MNKFYDKSMNGPRGFHLNKNFTKHFVSPGIYLNSHFHLLTVKTVLNILMDPLSLYFNSLHLFYTHCIAILATAHFLLN